MTDRELLEAAAKAAGFGDDQGRTIWTGSEYPPRSGLQGALWNGRGYADTAELWNPLADDGDALRLAVKLHMTLDVPQGYSVSYSGGVVAEQFTEPTGADPYAATRRAIVRAAAAMAPKTTAEPA